MNSSAPATPTDFSLHLRFASFIEALCQCVAAEGSKHRIAGPLVVLIWTRLRPLCHTLGIRTFAPPLALPPRRRKHRKKREPGTTEPDNQTPATTTSRRKNPPSFLAPRPEIPGWPRLPGSAFFTGLKFRT